MKKRVLAMIMAAFVTAGTVLAPAETESAYAAEAAQEEMAEAETAEAEAEEAETEEIEETAEAETEEIEETEQMETKTSALSKMPTGLLRAEAVGEITLDDENAKEEETEDVFKASAVYNNDWEKYGSYYFYNQLGTDEKTFWDALNTVCLKYMTTQANATKYNYGGTLYYYVDLVFSNALSLTDMVDVYQIFRYSNPQYYFLKSAYLTSRRSNGAYGLAPCVYPAFASGASRAGETQKVQSQAAAWQSQIDACATDEEKVKLIHDLVVSKVEYNHTLYNTKFANEDNEYSQSAYSVFCTDLTVCAGYSQAFEMMCNGSGIDAVSVTSADHEWNKVRINDSWYNVDCTWDDVDGGISYYYFERSDYFYDTDPTDVYKSHTEESIWDGYLPVCAIDTGATSTAPGALPAVTQAAAEPVISASVSGSSYQIDLTSATPGATIYYTTDGSEPNEAYSKGTRYTGKFTVAAGRTLKAVAVCSGYADSSVASMALPSLKTYKITFKSNGGKGKMSKQSIAKGVPTAISNNKFSKKYYTFAGWNTRADGKGKTYKNKASIKLTKNITLYAQWKLTKYKITYKLNGGKNAKKNPAAYTYKTSTIRLKNPTRKGYVFKGWYLDKKFKKKVTVINQGSSGNKTLYAKWKKK